MQKQSADYARGYVAGLEKAAKAAGRQALIDEEEANDTEWVKYEAHPAAYRCALLNKANACKCLADELRAAARKARGEK